MEVKKLIRSPQLIFSAAITVTLIVAIYVISARLGVETIREVVEKAGIFGPLIFILLNSLSYIIAPLSGTPFYLAGFALFGKTFLLYIYLSALLGFTINFWISRIWGRRLVIKLISQENITKIDQLTKDYGVESLIFLRVFVGYLTDFISYVYGLTNMKFISYFLISALAPIPWLMLWFLVFFPQIETLNDFLKWFIISLIPVYIISALALILYQRRKRI